MGMKKAPDETSGARVLDPCCCRVRCARNDAGLPRGSNPNIESGVRATISCAKDGGAGDGVSTAAGAGRRPPGNDPGPSVHLRGFSPGAPKRIPRTTQRSTFR